MTGPRGLLQEGAPIDLGAVGVAAEDVVGQDLIEPADIGGLDRADIVAVQIAQRVEIGLDGGVGAHAMCPPMTPILPDRCWRINVEGGSFFGLTCVILPGTSEGAAALSEDNHRGERA